MKSGSKNLPGLSPERIGRRVFAYASIRHPTEEDRKLIDEELRWGIEERGVLSEPEQEFHLYDAMIPYDELMPRFLDTDPAVLYAVKK